MSTSIQNSKILLVDNYDSFTYNLAQYFWEMDYSLDVHRHDQINIQAIKEYNPTHIVISPGPGRPEDAGVSLEVIEEFHRQTPILGICLGHQCLGQFFGGEIVRIEKPMHGKVSEVKVKESDCPVFAGIPSLFKATRYHSLVIKPDSIRESEIIITAESIDDRAIQGIQHKSLPLYGLQFHPESIKTEYGKQLLRNFIESK